MLRNSCKLFFILFFLLVLNVWAVEKPTSRSKSCVSEGCHNTYKAKKYVHGPVALDDCKTCHESVNEGLHTFKLVREGAELCSSCHLDQALEKHVHSPLETGNCTDCHDPHSSDYKFLIPVQKVSDLCQQCHEETLRDKKFLHGPAGAGQCTLCHNAHSSEYENLLTEDPKELCFFCHEDTKNELKRFEYVHQPLLEGGCSSCHDPHGANNKMILKEDVPQLCYPCHEDIKLVAENAKYKHDVVTQKGGCTKCHTPHASTVRFNLKADPMSLCVSCHDKEIKTDENDIIASFSEQIEDKKFLHGPVAQKDCKACHLSHGSDHFRLLTEEYPSSFYAPFDIKNYQLCFSCHPENVVLTEQTTELTDFRNGSLNLHYLHVNKPGKGRTCRACHATHASNHPKHIREEVPFGMWNIPIGFEKTDTGGSCQPGCHKPTPYDRVSPVSYKSSDEEEQNSSPGEQPK